MQVKTFIGLPPSKKNSKQIIINRKTRKPMIVSSAEYQKWERKYGGVFASSFNPIGKANVSITFITSGDAGFILEIEEILQ